MSFATDVDEAIKSMVTGQKAAVKSALTTAQTALSGEQTTYGSPSQEEIWLNERLLTLGRDLASQMR